jgi:hypothetical protein
LPESKTAGTKLTRSQKAILEPTEDRKKGRTVESPLAALREWALDLSRAPEAFSDFDGPQKTLENA